MPGTETHLCIEPARAHIRVYCLVYFLIPLQRFSLVHIKEWPVVTLTRFCSFDDNFCRAARLGRTQVEMFYGEGFTAMDLAVETENSGKQPKLKVLATASATAKDFSFTPLSYARNDESKNLGCVP